jgi:hypothetical protein
MDNSCGRTLFETRPADRDYSGLSITDRYPRARRVVMRVSSAVAHAEFDRAPTLTATHCP